MAREPAAIEHQIDEIRGELDDVADELDARIAAFRQKVSVRYILRHHPRAVALITAGAVVLLAGLRGLRRRRIARICGHCT